MKKIIALAAAIVSSVALASAEIAVGARGIFQIGVGSTISDDFKTFMTSTGADMDSSVGFGGGFALFAHIPVAGGLAIQPELGFTHNSIGLDIDVAGQSVDGSLSCNTLNIPILIAYDIKAGDGFTISPFVGPQIGIILGDVSFEVDGNDAGGDVDTSVLFGILVGASAAIEAGPGALVADLRYDIGINAIKSVIDMGTPRGLQLSLGYQLQF